MNRGLTLSPNKGIKITVFRTFKTAPSSFNNRIQSDLEPRPRRPPACKCLSAYPRAPRPDVWNPYSHQFLHPQGTGSAKKKRAALKKDSRSVHPTTILLLLLSKASSQTACDVDQGHLTPSTQAISSQATAVCPCPVRSVTFLPSAPLNRQ